MLLNACRIAARQSILVSVRHPRCFIKTTLSLRSLSTTSQRFEARSSNEGASFVGEFETNDFSPTDIPGRDSTLSSPYTTNSDGSTLEELDLTQFADTLHPAFQELAAKATAGQSLAEAGLGGWSPPGLVQTTLDQLHSMGLPWWAAIAVSTLAVKLLLFPLTVRSRRSAINVQNCMPEAMKLQLRMSEARLSGDMASGQKAAEELRQFYREKNCNPFSPMLPMLAQAPIFISFFIGIREMAAVPLASMKTGGLLWFSDLTIADPLYILPLFTSLTMLASIELGAETGVQSQQQAQMVRYILRGVPVLMFPVTLWFPSAILCYWATTNVFTLGQVVILNMPAVRRWLKIPDSIRHNIQMPPVTMSQTKTRDFLRQAVINSQISKEFEERGLAEKIRQRQAAMKSGPDTAEDGATRGTIKRSPNPPLKIRAIEHGKNERKQ